MLKECSRYDLAYFLDQHRFILRTSRSVDDRSSKVQWLEDLPLQILLHRLRLFLLLVLVPWLYCAFPECLCVRRLDSPE